MPRPSECGFATPPPDDTPEREAIDRFAEFLHATGGPPTREHLASLSPARRYHVRLLAWRLDQGVTS